jgi:hypothetical protein
MTKNNVKIYITRKELGLYQHEKMRKDLVFFQSVTPYIRFAMIGASLVGMMIYYYNVRFATEKTNFSKKFFLKLLDLEENK